MQIKKYLQKIYGALVLSTVKDEARNFARLLSRFKVDTLIDLGTGEERYFTTSLIPLKDTLKPRRTISIDKFWEFVSRAPRYGVKGIVADFSQGLPLVADCADMLFANQVIEHMRDVDNFIQEIKRVLKKDGIAVICTENLSSWHNIFALFFGWQPFSLTNVSYMKLIGNPLSAYSTFIDAEGKEYAQKLREAYLHHKIFTYQALMDIFQVYGFKVLRVAGSGYYPCCGFLARCLAKWDSRHAAHLTVIARKE